VALPRKNRIISKNDFQDIFKKGRTVSGSFFFIKYTASNLGLWHWAIVVPVNVSKKSTERNRVKRKISECLARIKDLSGSFDAVVVASHAILDKSFEEIKSDLEKTIKKVSVNPVVKFPTS